MRRACSVVMLCVVLPACPPEVPAPPQLTGDGWVLTLEDDTFTFSRAQQPLVTLPASAFVAGIVEELDPLASYDPYWLLVDDGLFSPELPDGFAWREAQEVSATKEGEALQLSLKFHQTLQAVVRAEKAAEGHVRFTFIPSGDAAVAMLRVKLNIGEHEGLYGLGEWFDGINHRGKVRPMQLEPDLTIESSATENHVSVPLLIGSRGWGAFFESRRYAAFDVAKMQSTVVDAMFGTAEASGDGLIFHLFSSPRPLEVVPMYYRVTGAPRLPAEWALGPWIWRDENVNQAEVEDDVRLIRELDLPTSAIWIDRPYATRVNTFDFDAARYSDVDAMIATIHAAGLRLALWHTPYLEETAAPYRAEAMDAGYFPPEKGIQLNGWSPPLDFTNPAASAFWAGLVQRYVDMGIEGFKLDFAEDVAAGIGGRRSGWRFHDGSTELTMTDGYPRRYHDLYRDALGANDGFLLVRHARYGEQTRGVIVWPGDIDATLTQYGETFVRRNGSSVRGVGGLPSAIRAGIGLAASGFPLFAADTGGYRHSPPNKETFMRWAQQSALMPVMQTGDSSAQPPWLFTAANERDQEALDTYRHFARLHLRLFPYLWTLLRDEAALPPVRALGLAHPELNAHPEDQYFLGDALLVAPVEMAGATTRTLVKPPGRWFDFDDGAELPGAAGESVTVAAPLTKLPLFLREGALVAMLAPDVDTLSPATQPGVRSYANEAGALWVRVQPGTGQVTLFDGTRLTVSGKTLTAQAGTRFATHVVWELRGVTVGEVTHGGAAVAPVADEAELASVDRGFHVESGLVLIKTPLNGAATVWK